MSDRQIGNPFLTEDERAILQQSCEEIGIPSDIVEQMIAAETQLYGMGRRHGIWEMLESLVATGIQREQGTETQS